jgi:hypothetical protein
VPRALSVAAVVSTSAATLAFEVLLVRAFSIQYFNHLAFMAIGVAMLGVGVSGVAMALVTNIDRERALRWFTRSALCTPAALILSPALVDFVALDPTQLLWSHEQWVRLGVVYILLAIPFALGAVVVLLAITAQPERAGLLYGSSFLGGAVGGVVALVVSSMLLPDRTLAVPAIVAVAGVLPISLARRGTSVTLRVSAGLIGIAALVALVRPLWQVDVSPHKALPQIAAFPQAEQLTDRASASGWVTAVRSPAFRHAPGLSLRYRGTLPSQTALFVDGELAGAVVADTSGHDFYDWLPTAAPYALARPRSVLVINAAGGSEIGSALYHGVERVIGLESHGAVVELIHELTDSRRAGDTRVEWVTEQARSFAAGTRERFDLVTLEPMGSPGAGTGGVYSLNEDFLHTVDAYAALLELLDSDGVFTVTRWLSIPPRQTVRLILTAAQALRTVGADPNSSMMVLRSWGTITVLLKRTPFREVDTDSIRSWADRRGFDFDWYPGITEPTFRFHEMEDPATYHAARATSGGRESVEAFVESYPFDVSPVTDARPYPNHFLRLSALPAVLKAGAGTAVPFAELGLVAIMASFFQSLTLGVLFMVVPAAVAARKKGQRVSLRIVVYFAAIGLAYMSVEIAAIQQLTLLLGRPQYAVTAVLATFLVCSGIGSIWSDTVKPARVTVLVAGLTALVVVYAALLLPIVHMAQSAPIVARASTALALTAPPALLMGFPFALGLRHMAGSQGETYAWAWAANGFASVAATPLAALVALEIGTPWLFVVGATAYAVAGTTSGTIIGARPSGTGTN